MSGYAVRSKVLKHVAWPCTLTPSVSRLSRSMLAAPRAPHQHHAVRCAAAPAAAGYPAVAQQAPPQQYPQPQFPQPASQQGFYDQPSAGTAASRVFANFSLYKGKAASQLSVLSPTFKTTATGNYYVEKAGCVFLEFANAVEGTGSAPGERRYDWQNKQTFALSPVEFSGLVEPLEQKLVHDPQRGGPNQGSTMKTLGFRSAGDSGDWFLSLDVRKDGQSAKINLPVTKNEVATLRMLAVTIVPHLLGLDEVMNRGISISASDENTGSMAPF